MPVLAGMSMTPELQAANMLGISSLVIAIVTNQCFDIAARDKIEAELGTKLGQLLGDDGNSAKHTLSEANALLWPIVKLNQPSHEEVAENAGREDVTQRLEGLIGHMVRALRFE